MIASRYVRAVPVGRPVPPRPRLAPRLAAKTCFAEPGGDDDYADRMAAKYRAAMLATNRQKLNALYYENRKLDLTGDELRQLLEGRRPMLSVADDEIILEIYETQWTVEDFMWDSLAGIINEWSCGNLVRVSAPAALLATDGNGPVVIPLKIHAMFIRDMPEYPEF